MERRRNLAPGAARQIGDHPCTVERDLAGEADDAAKMAADGDHAAPERREGFEQRAA
jgi:hypothetical protein